MRQAVFELFKRLQNNSINQIVFYKNNKRQIKTFQDFTVDVDLCIRKLNSLGDQFKRIALIGPTSYEWMVFDFACIKGGFISIAVPESLSVSAMHELLIQNTAELILIDHCFKDKGIANDLDLPKFYFRCEESVPSELNFDTLEPVESEEHNDTNKIEEVYSIAFSSGTSGTIKHIKMSFNAIERKPLPWYRRLFPFQQIRQIRQLINYKLSFWSARDNKVIIYMPFSHLQQRTFVVTALFNNINILLSDPLNCAKHLIIEKPNIMVSVPLIYEVLADNIRKKILQYKGSKRMIFNIYNWGINGLSNNNPIKQIFSNYLFKDIRKIYGGRANYFITGSAPIKKEALSVFYSVGVKILEAYGQSEIGTISMSSDNFFKIGSVGKPVLQVKIGEHSEILVKYEEAKHKHRKAALNVDEDDYIHTGDAGYIDKSGFLFVRGRLDDVIVLKNGKKIFPETIDLKLTSFDSIKQSVTINNEDKLSAIISLTDNISKEDVKDLFIKINQELPDYSRINSYLIVPDLTIENGLLTSTFKIKRKEVIDRFKEAQYEYLSQ